MNTILCAIVVVLAIYFEWVLVKTMLSPIVGICVAIAFIFLLLILIVAELALIVVAPIALLFGCESREWHIQVARKLMFSGKEKDVDNS